MFQRKFSRPLALTGVAVVAMASLAACGNDDSGSGSSHDIAVTLITKNTSNPFFVAMADGAKKAGETEASRSPPPPARGTATPPARSRPSRRP
ncbi:MAG: hypothetical protein R2734_15560 [Nocardioides sp.]